MPVHGAAGGEDVSEVVGAGVVVVDGTGTGPVATVVDTGAAVAAAVTGAAAGEDVVVVEVAATLGGAAAAGALVAGATAAEGVVVVEVATTLGGAGTAGALVPGVTDGEGVEVVEVAAIFVRPIAVAVRVDQLFFVVLAVDVEGDVRAIRVRTQEFCCVAKVLFGATVDLAV
jgi:hypothetical protein